MRKQNKQMQLIIQHIQMNNSISDSSNPTTSGHHKGDHIRDVQKKISCMLNYIINLTL